MIWSRATRRPRPAGAVGFIELGFYEAMRGGRRLVRYQEREALLSVPPGVEDGERIPLDDGAFVVVRVRPQPRDSTLVRAIAAAGLLAAVAVLAFLFLG